MPMITFTCKGKGCSTRQWEGSLEILKRGNPCEAELCARGSRFHLIVGRHSYGNYLCIPNWDVGTELSSEYSGRFYTPIPEIGNRSSDVKETALPF